MREGWEGRGTEGGKEGGRTCMDGGGEGGRKEGTEGGMEGGKEEGREGEREGGQRPTNLTRLMRPCIYTTMTGGITHLRVCHVTTYTTLREQSGQCTALSPRDHSWHCKRSSLTVSGPPLVVH